MLAGRHNGPAKDRTRQQGAAIVESALVLPVVVLLTLGAIDAGVLFQQYLSAGRMSRDAARTLVQEAQAPDADHWALQALARNTAGISAGAIERIVIFRAATPSSAPPCTAPGDVTNDELNCNVYGPDDLGVDRATFLAPGYTRDDGFRATERDVFLADPPGTDLVGVHVVVRVSPPAGVLGGERTFRVTTVMRLEAQSTNPPA